MKVGIRKPSIKKSIKARTTGRVKRSIKSSVNPLYGKTGMGYVNDPKKAVYNKVYNKTTVGVNEVIKESADKIENSQEQIGVLGCIGLVIQLIVSMGQLIFYGIMLVGLIWFIIQVIKF
ncbi:hypothetical protein [Clostridium sp.]|uniref:hypothetical protein n=1 Tax=Clostridium sp. TaxID=1506 RepID=UPI003216D1BE